MVYVKHTKGKRGWQKFGLGGGILSIFMCVCRALNTVRYAKIKHQLEKAMGVMPVLLGGLVKKPERA